MKVSKTRRIFTICFCVVFFPVLLLAWIIVCIVRAVKKHKFLNSDRKGRVLLMESDMSKVDIMEGYVFEEFLKAVFFYSGYHVELTKRSNDFGVDLLLSDIHGKTTAVQSKRYNKTVGSKSVQEVASGRSHFGTNSAMVVTNSHFSPQAEVLARELDVQLVDREELVEMIAKVKAELLTPNTPNCDVDTSEFSNTNNTIGSFGNKSDFSI